MIVAAKSGLPAFSAAANGQTGNGSLRIDYTGAAVFGVLTAVVFIVLQASIQNLHIVTTNGLWKSMTLSDFMASPGWGNIDRSNVLLFPLHAAFCVLYDQLGIETGVRWRQMGLTNALFGGIGAAVSYAFAYHWTGSRPVAVLATAAYVFSGFFLLHGITNEDIMPAHVFALLATLLAAEWFGHPTLKRIVIVAVIFSLGWLIEWRVMFPPLPAFLLALLVAHGRIAERFSRIVVFLLAMFLLPVLFAMVTWVDGYRTFGQALEYARELAWTGKGVGSGWAGFTVDKLWIEASGMSEAVFGGRYLNDPNWLYGAPMFTSLVGLSLVVAMAVAGLIYAYPRRSDPVVRSQVIVFYGLLLGGAVFNAYSQPGDPQMQINVMLVALPGWVLIIDAVVRAAGRMGLQWLGYGVGLALVALPIGFSHGNMFSNKGYDAKGAGYIQEILDGIDTRRTVFVIHGFDSMLTWMSLATRNNVPNVDQLEPAPAVKPVFKWIDTARAAIEHPEWTGTEHAADIDRQISRALDLGYRVIAPAYWNNDAAYWAQSYAGIASKEKAIQIRKVLHDTFGSKPYFDAQNGSDFVELSLLK